MRFTYLNRTQHHSGTMNAQQMNDAPSFSMQDRNAAQKSKKLNDTLVSETHENQNKRVLFYELIR